MVFFYFVIWALVTRMCQFVQIYLTVKKKDFESIHYNVLTRQEASSSDHDICSSEVLAQGHHVDMPICLIQGQANESP